jgi:hypothetical protein
MPIAEGKQFTWESETAIQIWEYRQRHRSLA